MDRKSTTLQPAVESYHSNMGMFSPSFAQTAAYRRWRNIGGQHQLYTDEEIACFLMNCYDESLSSAPAMKEKCMTCGSPVMMFCATCEQHLVTKAISSQPGHSDHHHGSERCRLARAGQRSNHSGQQSGAPKADDQRKGGLDVKEFPAVGESPPPPPPPPPPLHHSFPQQFPPQQQKWTEQQHQQQHQHHQQQHQHQHQQQQHHQQQQQQQKQLLQQNLSPQQNDPSQQNVLPQHAASDSPGENMWGRGGEQLAPPPPAEAALQNYGTCRPSLLDATSEISNVEPSLWNSSDMTGADQHSMNCGPSVFAKHEEEQEEEEGDQPPPQDWQTDPSSPPFSSVDGPPSQEPCSEEDGPDRPTGTTSKPAKKKTTPGKEFFCQPCNKRLSSRQALDRHARSKLHAIALLPPEVQAKRRRRQKAANPQQANQDKSVYVVARNGDREEYLCKVCGQAFASVTEVKQHRRQHKAREMCHLCGKTVQVRGFREHMLRHSGQRQHPCALCAKTFVSAALLKDHAIVHTGEKPFCCEVCGACFRHRHTLKFHLRTHTGLKAYRCSQCHAAFTRPRGLSDHLRVHTGERPYSCQVCGRRFSSSGNLAAHRRKVHKLPPLVPSVPCRLLMT